ncbi:DUF4407 domain-containing protein [Mucilaginibacter angelicae]|uniref:DUF4407 domain-containing protein n=1 Tax=Mucilaginibacter angelicae TaxID=869718 RepID=A0ABV6LHS1_9SPHI
MKQFLYFLSKTDQTVVSRCPPMARNIQYSLGFFVLLTGTIALLSGTYAISNMFLYEDPSTGQPVMPFFGWPASIILGLVYATFIMAIDREIVSATNKITVAYRIPLAIVISLIISKPIEMQLFDSAVVQQLSSDNQHDQHNQNLSNELDANVNRLQVRFNILDSSLRAAVDSRNYWQKMKLAEIVGTEAAGTSGHPGEGVAFRQDDENMKAQQTLIDQYNSDLKTVKTELDKARIAKKTEYHLDKQKIAYDLLSKSVALNKVKDNDKSGTATRMGWSITGLFLLFEIIPSLMKLLLSKTEYDALIDKRRLLNILSTDMIYEEATSIYHDKSAEEISKENPVRISQLYLSQSD